jgi:hypothetical protein
MLHRLSEADVNMPHRTSAAASCLRWLHRAWARSWAQIMGTDHGHRWLHRSWAKALRGLSKLALVCINLRRLSSGATTHIPEAYKACVGANTSIAFAVFRNSLLQCGHATQTNPKVWYPYCTLKPCTQTVFLCFPFELCCILRLMHPTF